MKLLRQGDVLLVKVGEKSVRKGGPLTIDEVARKDGELVLAFGEQTHHSHRVTAPSALMLRRTDGRRFLRTTESSRLVHEEHDPVDLDAGFYEVIRQREFEPGLPFVDVND